MEIAWTVTGIVVPVLFTLGYTFVGLAPPEFRRAHFCFIGAAIALGGMEIVWYTQTGYTFFWRVAVASMICLTIGIGLPETLRWVHRRELAQAVPPPPEAPKTPLGSLEAPSSTIPSNERNLPSSKTKTRNLGPESVPEVPSKPVETARERQEFLVSLTRLYIASHDGISSEMMAGLQLPPDDWLNGELAKRGKAWHVELGRIVDNITKADHPTLPSPQTPAVPPRSLHVSESGEVPKPLRRLIFTQEQTNSTHDDAPFAVKIVIQTTATVQPTSLAIICDSEVAYADSRLGGGANRQRTGDGVVNNDKRIYRIFWGEPPFTPESPLVLTLMSKTAIHALAVQEGPAYPF